MIKTAWNVRKSVLFLCIATAAIAVATSLTELFVAPVILGKVETAAPLPELLTVIVGFAGLLMLLAALNSYVDTIPCSAGLRCGFIFC